MLPQPIFGDSPLGRAPHDRSLSDSLYRAVVNRFYDSLTLSTQALLGECTFGFAPSPEGVKTFFIVAPSLTVAEELLQDLDNIANRVTDIMVGVGQIGLCINPADHQTQPFSEIREPETFPPRYMACKFFSLIPQEEITNE